ncbi:MAG: hypothetical protein IJA76_00650 [Clostridia bacterium]|nr:hypothetical protein [Clostridia bacterium]
MKKLLTALLCMLLVFCLSFALTACGDNPADNTGDGPSTSTPGGEDNEGEIFVTGVNLPANIRAYLVNSGERENEDQQFFVLNSPYKVGDDNAFRFLPDTTFEDELEIPVQVDEHEYTYVLEERTGETYSVLDETYLDAVDTIKCEFDFAEQAIGKTVRLTVTPTGLKEDQIDDPKYSAAFEFVVVDGYNVYEEIELGYMHYKSATAANNEGCRDITDANKAWNEFLTENGYTRDPGSIKAIILHDNMNITAEDIPSHYLYSEEEIDNSNIPAALRKYYYGSMKNAGAVGIYTRNLINDGDSFSVLGNYYTVDISQMPVILKMDNKSVEFDSNGMVVASSIASQSQLFMINGNLLKPEQRFAHFENFNIIGNSPKTNDKRAQGGLMFVKTENTTTTVDNVISKRVFITAAAKRAGKLTVTNLKCYDSFSSPFHAWMARDGLYCDNVIAKNSGGPAIIVETAAPSVIDESFENHDVALISKVIATNCVFENWNDGTEAWYYMGLGEMAAAVMPQIKSLNAIPQGIAAQVNAQMQQAYPGAEPINASFLKEDGEQQLFNVYCVVLDGKGGLAGAAQTAYVEINGNVIDYGTGAAYYSNVSGTDHGINLPPVQDEYAYKANSAAQYYGLTLAGTIGEAGVKGGAPVLESTGGSFLYWNGSQPILGQNQEYLPFVQGGALNLYYSIPGTGMGTVGLMFEYMH